MPISVEMFGLITPLPIASSDKAMNRNGTVLDPRITWPMM